MAPKYELRSFDERLRSNRSRQFAESADIGKENGYMDKPGFTEALRAAARSSKLSGPLKGTLRGLALFDRQAASYS
jgi:hypothetical protein